MAEINGQSKTTKAVNGHVEKKRNGAAAHCSKKFHKYAKNTSSVCGEIADMCRQVDCRGEMRRMCSLDNLKSKLPITQWLPKYRLRHLQGDFIAGITVGLMIIPQGLAYAKLAELPTQFGLYAAIGHCFLYPLFGTSRELSNGPCAIMALLTSQFGKAGITGDTRAAVLLTFLCGVIQIAMAVMNIGFVLDYVSHPVINSFTTAAAITIFCSQLKKWLGLRKIPRKLIPSLITIAKKLGEVKIYDFTLGLVCMILLYILKKIRESKCAKSCGETGCAGVGKNFLFFISTARNAVVVILATSTAAVLYNNGIMLFSLTGPIMSGIPPFQVPEFSWTIDNVTYTAIDNVKELGAGVFIVPVLAVIESIAIAKALGRKSNYNVAANQEILALGASNLFGSFLSAFPVAGAFSRSAVNSQSGVQTPVGGIFTGIMVLLSLQFLTPLFFYIPEAALAAVIMMAISNMIDFSMIPHMWRVKKIDIIPWVVTFIASLAVGVEYGIVIGVLISLLPLLHPWSRPKTEKQEFDNQQSNVVLFTVDMGLLFPAVESLEEKICESAFEGKQPRSVVVNFVNVSHVDYTAVHGMQQIQHSLLKKNVHLVLCNLRPEVKTTFSQLKHPLPVADSVEEALSLVKDLENADKELKTSVQGVNTAVVLAVTPLTVDDDTLECTGDGSGDDDDDNDDGADVEPSVDLHDVISE